MTAQGFRLVADYADGSGRYRIYRFADRMLTDFDGEAWISTLVPAPDLVAAPAYVDGEPFAWADYVLDEVTGFASNFDDTDGCVLAEGQAYRVGTAESFGMDEAREILTGLGYGEYAGYGDRDSDPLWAAGNVVTLPTDAPVVGAVPLEETAPDAPGYPEYAAMLIAACYARGQH